ncbi:YbhB/YbcL family Raf kinase inhibitor-like protein [Arthrobacter sp. I2-34]|uniref:YbhB/YbcL family Raf kinase inhibitor-like protein n=1 Tax=Arthrobacter hankyongi TaxID=2904801 RepID=A0ABS9L5R0_9MICC|nr:YbhB/YbcL family Raf kinase inhibitor-like protein [Arthrobacter hankyongi]MCG2621966.1 YbhB/YbcL family Raf kinase inhibitor-like protein [Arthrobacter hankyongi]
MFEGALEIRDPLAEKPRSITLTSRAIPDGSVIDSAYAARSAGGRNHIPDLHWEGAPGGTRSFAVTCFDPDAPTGSGFWHWIEFDIPAGTTDFGADTSAHGTVAVSNDYGHPGYGGPNPPAGETHRYVFTVYALDVEKLGLPASTSHTVARFNIMAHTLASGSFTATFAAR